MKAANNFSRIAEVETNAVQVLNTASDKSHLITHPEVGMLDGEGDYFNRPEVSNSDLSWLKLELLSAAERQDFTNAYRMGSLIDCMITEPERINYFTYQLLDYPDAGHNEQFTKEEFAVCEMMKKAFRQDEFCISLLRQSTGQKVMSRDVLHNYGGFEFTMAMRCKYDLWSNILGWGGDIKSTTATTQKQFEESIRYFDYDRQRVNYMNISGASKDMIIGISKVNYKIFKVPITRDSELFNSGMKKLTELAFKWYYLFENF